MNETTKKRPHGPQEYRGNGTHKWEDVVVRGATKRLRVPGGWLYRYGFSASGTGVAMCFVPVPETVGDVI